MAQLRLIALALLIACRASEAGPGSGLTPPAGWQAQPSLANAATTAAKNDGLTVAGAEAWGEPARGCFAAWIAMSGSGGAPDVMADQLVRGLSADPALGGIVVRDVQKPAPNQKVGVLTLAFEHTRYHGKLRAALNADGKITALACFWNQREPATCERACTALLGSMK